MKKILILCFAALLASPVLAQKYGKTPEDSVECIKNLSIYQEFYKQRSYTDAYVAWKEVIKYCPKSSLNTYIRGNVILKHMIAKAKTPELKVQYIKELIGLWDLRRENYGQPGYCLGMKGRDMRTYLPDSIVAAKDLFVEAMTYGEERGVYPIPFWFLESVIDAHKVKLASKEDILEAYDRAASLLEKIKAENPGDTNIDNALFGMDALLEPYASCPELMPIYEKKFESNKNNAEFLKKATYMLDAHKCTSTDLFFKLTEALHAVEPTAQSAYMMARMCYAKKDYKTAISYMESQAGKMDKGNEKMNAYMLLADSYMNTNQYTAGREACLSALKINPNEGKAYLMIGNLYAASAKSCGGDQIGQRAGYWTAVDKYIKAKQVDPTVTETADKLIAAYRIYFPSGDDLFTFGFKEGSSYTVSCWYTETTVIRAR